jgi:hypothetical protein
MAYTQQTTRSGYFLFEMAGLMQKSIRRGNVKLAAYAAMEMFGNYWAYMWRRLIVVSAEDCYGIVTKEVIALREADVIANDKRKGYDRDPLFAAKAVVLLCMARKNRDGCYVSCNFMLPERTLTEDEFQREGVYVDIDELELKGGIPEWVFDVHTQKGRARGKTDLDMTVTEQDALTPKQLNMFDDGDWHQYYEMQRRAGRCGNREYEQFQNFKKSKVPY